MPLVVDASARRASGEAPTEPLGSSLALERFNCPRSMVLITGIRQPINPRGATRLGIDDAADELGRCFHRREVPAVLQLGYHPRPIVGGEGPRQAVRPVADLVFEHRLAVFKDSVLRIRSRLPGKSTTTTRSSATQHAIKAGEDRVHRLCRQQRLLVGALEEKGPEPQGRPAGAR